MVDMDGRRALIAVLGIALLAAILLSCGSNSPNEGRILLSVAVTPATADAQNFPAGQVTFSATGTFSTTPLTGPVSFAPPYTGQFVVDNPDTGEIADVVDTGSGTVTVRCAAGASGNVEVIASAYSNNGTNLVISGSGVLTCP